MLTTETTRRLVVVTPGPLEHRVFEITSARVLVGRSAEADLQLDGSQVSRIHALIEERDGGTVVHDLSSTNGTTVNGTRLVQPYALRDGDVVGIGSFELRFEERSCDAATAGLAVPQASFTVQQQTAGTVNNVGHDQYVYNQQRESFLREIARTKTKATWLVVFGFLLYVVGGAAFTYGILKFDTTVFDASNSSQPPDGLSLFGDKVAGAPVGIWGFAAVGVGSILLIVGIVLHVVAAARKRQMLQAPPAWAGA
jgi:hypothetical protein